MLRSSVTPSNCTITVTVHLTPPRPHTGGVGHGGEPRLIDLVHCHRNSHYNKGAGLADPWLDEDIQPLALTEPEIDDLVAFLASLTSAPYKDLGNRELARQLALSKVSRPQRDTPRAFGPKPEQPKPPF